MSKDDIRNYIKTLIEKKDLLHNTEDNPSPYEYSFEDGGHVWDDVERELNAMYREGKIVYQLDGHVAYEDGYSPDQQMQSYADYMQRYWNN